MGVIPDGADQEVKETKEGARWKGEQKKEDEEKKNTQVNAMEEKGEKGKEKKENERDGTEKEEKTAKEKEEKQKSWKTEEDQTKKRPMFDKITAEKGMEVNAPHGGPSNQEEGLENGSQTNFTGKWEKWRKVGRQDSLTELKLTLFRLAK